MAQCERHHHSFRRKLLSTLSCGATKQEAKLNPDFPTGPEIKKKQLEEVKGVVNMLESSDMKEIEKGVKMVRRLAKDDSEARSSFAMLGVIPLLVAMIDHHDCYHYSQVCEINALYALLNLGIGNDLNKAAVVQAGLVHKMLKKINSSKGSLGLAISEAIVANFLALSALDSNKIIIGTSGAIPFLVSILQDTDNKSGSQSRHDSLRALYNLSISPPNIVLILQTNLIHYLINSIGNIEMSERILSILSNVVSNLEGRKSISSVPDALPTLIDVLSWTDLPGCQEKASYVLMVMAHKSYTDRHRMIEAGINSALLELTLLGSTLAQKRASRILECLRVDKGKQVSRCFSNSTFSASINDSFSSVTRINKDEEATMSEERKAVKQLVQQSLQSNMKRIVRRANLPHDYVSSEHLSALIVSSTSKSLSY